MRGAALMALFLVGCQAGSADVFVPQYNPMWQRPTALLTGTLVVDEGCVWIDAEGDRYLALWPTTIKVIPGDPLAIRGNGVGALEGEEVAVGGGETGRATGQFVEDLIRERVPERCRGDAWLVTELLPGPIP